MRYIAEQTHLQTTLTNKLKSIYMIGIEKIKNKTKLILTIGQVGAKYAMALAF